MPLSVPFKQVDVFTDEAYKGNPVAVINCMEISESQVTTELLQSIANWTNLSETTFLFKPSKPEYDYKVRIFTPDNELPFAGHPTIGSCKAYLEFSGKKADTIYQECGVGIITLTVTPENISFKANKANVHELSPELIKEYQKCLNGITPIATPKLIDAGPLWVIFLLDSDKTCYNLEPDFKLMSEISKRNNHTGIILGGLKNGSNYEMRAFAPSINVDEDPVCGSGALSFIRYLNDLHDMKKTTQINITQGGRVKRNGKITGRIETDGSQVSYHIAGNAHTLFKGEVVLEL